MSPTPAFDPDVTPIRHAHLAVEGATVRAARTLGEAKVEMRAAEQLASQALVHVTSSPTCESCRNRRALAAEAIRSLRGHLRRALGMNL